FMQNEWEGFEQVSDDVMLQKFDTSFNQKKLDEIAAVITELPSDKKFINKISRLMADRKDMYFERNQLDWAMGELLAYGSLLTEGYDVRMSGQDVERGTFSHRHAVVNVEDSEEEVIRLNEIKEEEGNYYIYNSHVSGCRVGGVVYGYTLSSPNTLTMWEAPFADFSNGAQSMTAHYISEGEDKWNNQNGLVMLLPHG